MDERREGGRTDGWLAALKIIMSSTELQKGTSRGVGRAGEGGSGGEQERREREEKNIGEESTSDQRWTRERTNQQTSEELTASDVSPLTRLQ